MTVKKISKAVFVVLLSAAVGYLSGCSATMWSDTGSPSQSSNPEHTNLYPHCGTARSFTLYNLRTDTVLLYVKGWMNVTYVGSDRVVLTLQVGEGEYRDIRVPLSDDTTYVVEELAEEPEGYDHVIYKAGFTKKVEEVRAHDPVRAYLG